MFWFPKVDLPTHEYDKSSIIPSIVNEILNGGDGIMYSVLA